MIRGIDSINLYSEDATRLANFYKDMLGLKTSGEFVMGEDDSEANVYNFDLGSGSGFSIIDHSEVKGKNTSPARYMINFEVDDIKSTVEKLKKEDVKVIADTYHIEMYGWVATFEDPDGNYFQLVQVRES